MPTSVTLADSQMARWRKGKELGSIFTEGNFIALLKYGAAGFIGVLRKNTQYKDNN